MQPPASPPSKDAVPPPGDASGPAGGSRGGAKRSGDAGAAGDATRRQARRRRPFLRAFARALTDPSTFDLRRNPSLWLGALLAIPIPVLAFVGSNPTWIELLSLVVPIAWALALGAAGRVSTLEREEILRLEAEAHQARTASALLADRSGQLEAEQRVMTAELKLAQAIQRTLIPKDIVKPEVQVVVRNIPCSFVGGDYLQASMPRPDVLYLCVGDVSGHGVAAALVVSRVHGLVRRLILEQRSPVQFLDELNKATLSILEHTYFFMTFAVFRVDLAARRIEYATAGHPAQLLLRHDGQVEALSTPNRLLGMDVDIFDPERSSDSVSFGPGDSLVLFTDGLFEIPGAEDGEILGEAGLEHTLRNLGGLPPPLVAGDILQDLADFQGTSKFEDDVSLMVARFEPTGVASTSSVSVARPSQVPAGALGAGPAAAPAPASPAAPSGAHAMVLSH